MNHLKKKICFITCARSEYGLLKWLIKEFKEDQNFETQLIVGGSHLSPEFGYTYKEIENDLNIINEKIDFLLTSDLKKSLVKSMGVLSISIADAFHKLRPNLIIVLGDRYELLSICSSALIMNIPIAHFSGGDVTSGAIDNQIRNAISQIATLHFPGCKQSAEKLISMGVDKKNVYNVGELGVLNYHKRNKKNRSCFAKLLNIEMDKKWVLMTYHPETKLDLDHNLKNVQNILEALSNLHDVNVIITKANADYGGIEINRLIETKIKRLLNFVFIANLGQDNYLSLLDYLYFMIGNSSSGIVEAPSAKLPFINIGKRQDGRMMAGNVINADGSITSIEKAIIKINSASFITALKKINNPYGSKNSFKKIKSIIIRCLNQI